MANAKDREWIRRIADATVWKALEDKQWNSSGPLYLMPEEMGEDPAKPLRRRSEEECPPADFPYRAMTEDEVRAFAQGVGRMTTNARKANEDAYASANSGSEMIYRVQVDADLKVLKLLEKVLRGEYPARGAN